MQVRTQGKKRLKSMEIGTQNRFQNEDLCSEAKNSCPNEDLKVQGTQKTSHLKNNIFGENHHFGLISQEFGPQKHDFPHINEISDSPNTTQEKSSDGPPKWHKEGYRPPQWVFNYLQVWSKKQLEYVSRDSKNSEKHEVAWRDPTSLIFERTHTHYTPNRAS